MSDRIISRSFCLLGGLVLTLLSACAVDGYGAGVDVGYVGGVYAPYGYDYGGWGGGYRVGPPRWGPGPGPGGGGWRGGGHPGGGPPSIPGGPHGGGGHGGGHH